LAVNQQFDRERCLLLRSGIELLRGHLMATDFTLRDAAIAAGQAALLAAIVKSGTGSGSLDSLRYDDSKAVKLAGVRLQAYPELAKLSGASPEAFHYWHLLDKIRRAPGSLDRKATKRT